MTSYWPYAAAVGRGEISHKDMLVSNLNNFMAEVEWQNDFALTTHWVPQFVFFTVWLACGQH